MLIIIWRILVSRNNDKKENDKKIELGRIQLIQSAKMATLGEMASGIAHEINNPLTIILGKSKQIQRQIQQTEGVESNSQQLSKIISAAERIGRIINGLRTFSRSSEGDPFQIEPLSSIIHDTISLCEERFLNHKIPIEIDEIPLIYIPCRPSQISQVFLNLLSNSLDAVDKLTEKWVKIKFTIDISLNQINIEFTDSGHGIPKEIANRIMQPFFTTKDVGSGTGLGLSISKGIIEKHHGKIALDSSAKNTKFIVTLPFTNAKIT